MHPRAQELIRRLKLEPHPEGGRFAEVHRSPSVTTIYFLLADGESSRWHRIRSEEIWHFYEGAPLHLLQLSPDGRDLQRRVLGPFRDGQQPVHCVPGNHWQAARSSGDYTLVGCTVAPAFQFADFSLLSDDSALAEAVRRNHPDAAQFV